MATIYRARDEKALRDVAIKIVKPNIVKNKTAAARFHREAKAASKLAHPGIVSIMAYGFDGALPYIAMELVEGEDLFELLDRRGALSEGEALSVVIALCGALDVAHAQGVVHRDLKPENIMVRGLEADDEPVQIKVLDFGIAKLVGPSPGDMWGDETVPQALTKVGSAVGTPSHMAPEQARGDPVDGRTDIYACGVLLYEMVTGHLPFEGDNPLHVAIRQVRDPPPPPSTHNPDLHPELEAIILCALEKDPAARFQTAAALRHALTDVLSDIDPNQQTAQRTIDEDDDMLTAERSIPSELAGSVPVDEDDDGEPLTAQREIPHSLRHMIAKRQAMLAGNEPATVDRDSSAGLDLDDPLTNVAAVPFDDPPTMDLDTIAGPTMRRKVEKRLREVIDQAAASAESSADATARHGSTAVDEPSTSDRTPFFGRRPIPRPETREPDVDEEAIAEAVKATGPGGTFRVASPGAQNRYEIEDEDSEVSIATMVADPNELSSSASQVVLQARAIAEASMREKSQRSPATSITKQSDLGLLVDAAASPPVQVIGAASEAAPLERNPNLMPTMPPPPMISPSAMSVPASLPATGARSFPRAQAQSITSDLPIGQWAAGQARRGAANELEHLLKQMPRQRQPIVGSVIVLVFLGVAIAALIYLLVGAATF